VKVHTLRKSAHGLSGWNEHEPALSVVKRDGTSARSQFPHSFIGKQKNNNSSAA